MLKGYHNAADARLQSASVSLGKVASKLGSLSSVVYWRAMESELWSLLPFSLAVAATVCSSVLWDYIPPRVPLIFKRTAMRMWLITNEVTRLDNSHISGCTYRQAFFKKWCDADSVTLLHVNYLAHWEGQWADSSFEFNLRVPSQQKDQSPSRRHQYITTGLLRERLPTHDLKCAF